MNSMTRNILIGVGALVVLGGVGYGVYSWMNQGNVTVEYKGETLQSADICGATLNYAALIGVVSHDATLAVDTSTNGDADDRVVCTISGNGETYKASVDIRCPQVGQNPACTDLQKVVGPKDALLFKRID